MNYQVHLRGPGLNMFTRIKSDALNDLLRLLQDHRDDQGGPPGWPEGPRGERPGWRVGLHGSRHGGSVAAREDDAARSARKAARLPLPQRPPEASAVVKKLAPLLSPPLADHSDLTFPEKLLLLGAWTEARKEKFILRGPALAEALVQAGQTPPANPKRDVMAAVRSGWITLGLFPNPSRATLTAEGWRRVAEMLG
jgi:hypothetical protein